MVKLTPQLIHQSMQYHNPCRDRELNLRGYKIAQVENLAATLDQFDTIDLSDNDLRILEDLPFLPRLKCLLLNNNRIVRIAYGLQVALPNLNSLILTGNKIKQLSDLEPLASLPHLETVSLLVNPVTEKPFYREYMAYKFPQLRLLDFRKIKPKERLAVEEFFRTKQGMELLAVVNKSKLLVVSAAATAAGADGKAVAGANLARVANDEDMQRLRDAIKRAGSLQEVERLSRILQSGDLPENFELELEQNGTILSDNPTVGDEGIPTME